MTYQPVANPSGRGRKALPIPPALIAQLEHTYATGCRATIERAPGDDQSAIDELRRALVRAGYQRFPDRTIHKRFTPTKIIFWMTDKRARGDA